MRIAIIKMGNLWAARNIETSVYICSDGTFNPNNLGYTPPNKRDIIELLESKYDIIVTEDKYSGHLDSDVLEITPR